MRRPRLPDPVRIPLRAALRMADELLSRADAYLAAVLDVRSLKSLGTEAAVWLGSTWRRHREAARIEKYGPGRGLLVVFITEPTDTKEHK